MIAERTVERLIRIVMVVTARPEAPAALFLLDAGVLLLMTVPLLRVAQSAARAVVLRDWLHVGTIVAVAALLVATIWYAARVAGA